MAHVSVTASFDGPAGVGCFSGKELFTLSGHTGSVFNVAFSPDGTRIATVSEDKTANGGTHLPAQNCAHFRQRMDSQDAGFSPDGSQLAVGSRDGTTRIYLLHIEDLIALAKSRLTRQLTLEECQQYLHMDACPDSP